MIYHYVNKKSQLELILERDFSRKEQFKTFYPDNRLVTLVPVIVLKIIENSRWMVGKVRVNQISFAESDYLTQINCPNELIKEIL